jgi:hypothetical protein
VNNKLFSIDAGKLLRRFGIAAYWDEPGTGRYPGAAGLLPRFLIAAISIAFAQAANSQSCPANAHVDHVEVQGDIKKIICKCDAGYQKSGGSCAGLLSPPGERLPSISPGFFVTDDERGSLCEHVRDTDAKYAMLKAQLDRLAAGQSALDRAAADVDEIRAELWQDIASDSLDASIASVVALQDLGAIASPSARANAAKSLTLLKSAKLGVNAFSTADAPADSKRQYTKAVDAVFTLKSLSPVPLLPNMSADEWAAFNNASNALPKLVQISERHVDLRIDQGGWPQYLRQMTPTWLSDFDDALSAVGKLVPPVQGAHATAHVVDGAVTLWLVRNDTNTVDQAFAKLQTARHYYQRRIGEVEQLSEFYRERLGRAGMQCR